MSEVIAIDRCRVCGCEELRPVLSLGDLYISTFVDKEGEDVGKAPLELVLCGNCSLLQLRHTAPQELMYSRHYWYQSGLNKVIIDDLAEIANVAAGMVGLKSGDIVLDIGANDGTLLRNYPDGVVKVGCEPADNLVSMLEKAADTSIHDFWSLNAWRKAMGDAKAKVVTAIGMFYDMDDPGSFIADAAAAMDDDGVFIAQLMCLRPMLEKNDVGNICHEHLEYYSYESLRYLFESNGLEIFKVEENSINGGSYRIFARPFKSGSMDYSEKFSWDDYIAFQERIEKNKRECVDFISAEVAAGKKVYVYGASTKGNTILQYYGLNCDLIAGAAEKSPEKFGKLTVGTWIPIVPEDEARARADYFLVLPWAFFDLFKRKEEKWLSDGGKFILSTPEFRVVGADAD